MGAAVLGSVKGYEVLLTDGGVLAAKYKAELDTYGIAYEEGGHSIDKILKSDLIVKSPGVPEKAAVMQQVRAQGIPVWSEVELAYAYKGDSRIVAITGTNGKSTTTTLIYHICRHAGLDCALVGNIGYSFARQVALEPKPLYVAEISSFQLDDIHAFRANIAVLLNITEDHLDRYNYQFEQYVQAKFKILQNLTSEDVFVYNLDDEAITNQLKKQTILTNLLPFSMKQELRQGAFIKDEEMLIRHKDEEMKMSIHDFAIKGLHNQYNSMAAGASARALDIRKDKISEAMQSFTGLAHRMEPVLTIKGVEYINDSKATNINGVWYALESMQKPVVLIMGGIDKGNDYSIIEDLVKDNVKAIVCLGLDNSKIVSFFKDKIPMLVETRSMEEAVQAAYQIANSGDVVLLSPACASFDLFKNYEDRGNQFKAAVKNL